MKIVRVIEAFYPFVSGPANQACMISKKMQEAGHDSPIITTMYGAAGSKKHEIVQGIDVTRLKATKSFMRFFYTPELKKLLKISGADIIHAHNYRSYQTHAAYRTAREMGVPFIINTHGSLRGFETITKGLAKLPYKVFDIIGRRAIDDADAVIVSSQAEYKEALKFGVRKSRLHVIPMGIDVKDYNLKKTRKDDKTVLLFVGRICRDRNILPIIKAVEELNNPKIELRVVGGEVKRSDTEKAGYLNELKKYSSERKLNVIFTGPKYGKELKQEYCNADIFVYTSLWENFGQSILEAAAAGLPIIATDVGIANKIVNKHTGSIVESDPASIGKAVASLYKSDLRAKKGISVRELVYKEYNWSHIMQQYMTMYQNLL